MRSQRHIMAVLTGHVKSMIADLIVVEWEGGVHALPKGGRVRPFVMKKEGPNANGPAGPGEETERGRYERWRSILGLPKVT